MERVAPRGIGNATRRVGRVRRSHERDRRQVAQAVAAGRSTAAAGIDRDASERPRPMP